MSEIQQTLLRRQLGFGSPAELRSQSLGIRVARNQRALQDADDSLQVAVQSDSPLTKLGFGLGGEIAKRRAQRERRGLEDELIQRRQEFIRSLPESEQRAFSTLSDEGIEDVLIQRLTQKPEGAQSTVGKITSDIRGGRVDERVGQQALEKAVSQRPATQINIGAEKTEKQELAKVRVKGFEARQKRAQAAQDQIHNLKIMQEAVSDPSVYQGTAGEFITNIKKLGKTLGMEIEGTTNEGVLISFSNKQALRLRNPDSGLGLTGNTSERDLQFLKNSVPGITKTREQNLAIIEISLMVEQRKVQVSQLEQQYSEEKGTLVGFNKFLREWADENPLFTEQKKTELKERLSEKGSKRREPRSNTIDDELKNIDEQIKALEG